MRVAVPLFGEDVSPRFGYSTQVLIATLDESGIRTEGIQDVSGLAPWQLPEFLASLGAAKVICGGMHWRFQEEMQQRGIEVIWGVIGPAADALAAFQAGTLQRDQFLCRGRHGPGGRGHGRRGSGGPGGNWPGEAAPPIGPGDAPGPLGSGQGWGGPGGPASQGGGRSRGRRRGQGRGRGSGQDGGQGRGRG